MKHEGKASFLNMQTSRSPSAEPAKTGLAKTFHVLAKTPNEAAVAVLVAALDSPDPAIQEGHCGRCSIVAVLSASARFSSGCTATPSAGAPIIDQRQGSLTHALRDAVLGTDRAAVPKRLPGHRLVQGVRSAAGADRRRRRPVASQRRRGRSNDRRAGRAASAPPSSAPPSTTDRRDPQLIRRRAGGLLDASVSRYVKHTRREIITAFLLLSQRDNVVLKQILQDPHHPAYLPLIDDLLHDPHSGIVRLLLGFLDDPRAPSSVISVLIRRSDPKFIRNLLRKIGFAPSAAAAVNLKRIDSIGWLRQDDRTGRPAQRRRTTQSGAVDHDVIDETPGGVQDDRLSGPLWQTGRPRGRGRGLGPVRRCRSERTGPGGSGKRRCRQFRRPLCPNSANAASPAP